MTADRLADDRERLQPYLPRLLVGWLTEDPTASHRTVEGSVVFVDISGFTKLSERLAKRGKVGAEELADAIGACFTRLLAVAYGNGGGLIKFGGDALLLLFDGPDHPLKACRAAMGMRRALREIGAIQTAGGRVTLRMSVGVHSGDFHFFLVGGSHRELIITGPAASQSVLMEGTAGAGEVVVSPATAAMLPRAVLGEPKGPGVLLRREPRGLSTGGPDADLRADAEVLRTAIPVAIRERVLAEHLEPEHRRVTVAFLHFDGTDHLIAHEGGEAAAEALDELVRDVQDAVDEQRMVFLGTDIDADGGKIILAAGASRSTGNDEERMLLGLRRIAEGGRALPLRIGVNGGRVFAGDIGPPYRRTFTVMGDAVNLAARLMAAAEPGQVLATGEVLDRSRTVFETETLPPFPVKGKAKPVQAYRVGPVAGVRAEETIGDFPLVGRGEELDTLLAALDHAGRGSGRVVDIVGEPGIGKSRLVRELLERAGDATTVAVSCEVYESSIPYSPFRTMLRHLYGLGETMDEAAAADQLRALVADRAPNLLPWVPLLAIPLGLELPPTPETAQIEEEFLRPRLEQLTGELLDRLLDELSLLTIENAQWIDEPSAGLLAHLGRMASDRPWLLCITRREEAGFEPPEAQTLALKPLRREASEVLAVAASEEAPLAPHELAALTERSGGNPLFLLELVAAAQAAGGVDALPDSVEALLVARIDSLPSEDRVLLYRASVLGPTFDPGLLSAVLPDNVSPGPAVLARLAEFLHPEQRVIRFRSAVLRDAAYEALPYRVRRDLHARVGEAILGICGDDPDPEAARLSLHFFFAHRYREAWYFSRIAGERAKAIYANVEAATFYERALEAARRLDGIDPMDRADAWESLGDVRMRVGSYQHAGTAYRFARRILTGMPIPEARLLLKESWVPYRSGRFSLALRWITRGLKLLEGRRGREAGSQRGQLMVWYASSRQAQGRNREAVRWCERAIKEAERAGDRDALAHAYYILDWVYHSMGRPDLATHSPKALAIYEELGDLGQQSAVLNNMGANAYYEGRWKEALDLYARGREVDRRAGDEVNAAFGTLNIGEILSDQGHEEEAERTLREALRVFRAARDVSGVAYALGLLGRLASRTGRSEEAMDLFDEARAGFVHVGEERQVVEIDARVAECHVFRGDGGRALTKAEDTLIRAEASGGIGSQGPMLHRIRGLALMQLGRMDEAGPALQESLAAARSRSASYEVALTLRALGDLARLRGVPANPEEQAEADELIAGLGITRAPEVPLPEPAGRRG